MSAATPTLNPTERAQQNITRIREVGGRVRRQSDHGSVVSEFGVDHLAVEYTEPMLKALRARNGRAVGDLRALEAAGYEPAFKSIADFYRGLTFKRDTEAGQDFMKFYNRGIDSVKKAVGMSTFEGDSGGSLVFPEMASSIFSRSWDNNLWSRLDGYPVSGNHMEFPRAKDTDRSDGKRGGGILGHWEGEAQPGRASRPGFENVALKLKKVMVFVYVTNELIEDGGPALASYVNTVVREEVNFMLGNAVVRGNGIKQPQGYLNAPCKITVAKEVGQTAGTVTGQNVLDMWERRIAGIDQSDYEWNINQEVESELWKLELGGAEAAQLVYLPPGGMESNGHSRLMGKSVVPTEFQSGKGTEGDIAFVKLSEMLAIEKGGIVEAVSPAVEFLTDQMCYRFTIRADAKARDPEPIKPFQGTNTQSAFITLADRT